MSAPGPGAGRLRIAHVTATFPPYRGGTGNVAWHQARELARRGHHVRVLTAAAPGIPWTYADNPPGVAVRRLAPLVRMGNAPLLPGLLPGLRGFDLIHLHYPFYGGAELVCLASRLYGVPYIVTYHQDVLLAGSLAPVPAIHYRLLGRQVLAGARRLLFTTLDYGRTSFAAPLARRLTSMALPNGVDTSRFSPLVDGSAIRRQLGAAPGDVLALFVAGLDRAHYFKGLDVVLRALARAPAISLAVVGDGDLRPGYERVTQDLGLAARVSFAGRVSDSDLPSYYAAADVAVLPSTTRGEAFGVVLLEAMATGKPVLASDLPGVRALVQDTAGGRLVPPGDAPALAAALDALAGSPEERHRLGSAGRAAVEARYTWQALGERLEQIYRGALA